MQHFTNLYASKPFYSHDIRDPIKNDAQISSAKAVLSAMHLSCQ